MTQPGLPRLDSRNQKSCLAYIARLPITNPLLAQTSLSEILAAMHAAPPSAADYLDVLEMLRAPLAAVQKELAKNYATKPLPFNEQEDEYFHRVIALWQRMAKAYAQIAQIGGTDAIVQAELAKICQRCLHYAGHVLLEHFRARHAVAPLLWFEFHGYYATAEDWGLATTTVVEPLGESSHATTCARTYAHVLLVDLANPYGHDPGAFGRILDWAEHFSQLTEILAAPDEAGCRGYAVDLMQDYGVRPAQNLRLTESVRLLDTSRLGPALEEILALLKQGHRPVQLGISNDFRAYEANRLLLHLHRPWSSSAAPRRFVRLRCEGELPCAYGFESSHYYVGGKEFAQPEHVRLFSRADMDALWTFRNQLDPTQPLYQRTSQLGYTLEQWDIIDASLAGFRLARGKAGGRIEHGGLLCLKSPSSSHYQLARISWARLHDESSLQVGLLLLPGKPRAISVRASGPGVSASEQYTRAFLLPALETLGEPPSLFVPRGWFYHGRIVEVFVERQVNVRLQRLLDQGNDFERVTYVIAEA